MAGALNSHFLQLRKAPNKNSKDNQQDRKQFLVAVATQHLTFRGNFYLPVQSLLGPSSRRLSETKYFPI